MPTIEPQRNVYVGHRYVPLILGAWLQTQTYEGLSIVTHMGDSYTSKKRVPIGIPITNEEYWVITGNYNAQIDQYRQEVDVLQSEQIKGKTGQKFQMIAGAIRNTGTGWGLISDSAHSPVGLLEPTIGNSTTLRVPYDFTSLKVGSLIFGVDETFQKKNIQVGASVGLTYADVKFSSPLNCVVMGDGIITAPSEHLPTLGVTKKSDQSGFTLNHYGGVANDTPVLTVQEDIAGNTGVDVRLGVVTPTSVEVLGYSDIGGYVSYNATTGQFVYTGINITPPTFVFNPTSGILSIEHELVLNADVMAVAQSNFKDYRINSAGNGTNKINIQFVDNAGVVALALNANMKFYFSRSHKVKSRMATTTKVAIRRGNVDINPVNLVDAAGNFWLSGLMGV